MGDWLGDGLHPHPPTAAGREGVGGRLNGQWVPGVPGSTMRTHAKRMSGLMRAHAAEVQRTEAFRAQPKCGGQASCERACMQGRQGRKAGRQAGTGRQAGPDMHTHWAVFL